jgi:hypothetical protein
MKIIIKLEKSSLMLNYYCIAQWFPNYDPTKHQCSVN